MANKFQLELIEHLNKLEKQRDYLASRMSDICRVCRGSTQKFCDRLDCIAVDYEQTSTEDWIEESKKEHHSKKQEERISEEYVVCCAAIKTPDGIVISIPREYRHHYLLNNTNVHKLYEGKEEQGFLVYYRPMKQVCFFNREEAAKIVKDVELIDKERLFSEDL